MLVVVLRGQRSVSLDREVTIDSLHVTLLSIATSFDFWCHLHFASTYSCFYVVPSFHRMLSCRCMLWLLNTIILRTTSIFDIERFGVQRVVLLHTLAVVSDIVRDGEQLSVPHSIFYWNCDLRNMPQVLQECLCIA